jgi:hypothetical protein
MTDLSAVDAMVVAVREGLDRVLPSELAREVTAGALVIDTRPVEQRQRDGGLAGAIVIDRNVLEWRLDVTSSFRIPEVTSADQRIIIVCNEGYGSSLAAGTLRRLGMVRATDLVGGFQALLRASGELTGDGTRPR